MHSTQRPVVNGTANGQHIYAQALAPADCGSQEQKMRMEESLNRSITLVFWYKPHCEPIRLHHEVPTFPLFQLSQFPALVTDLGLSPTSYIDAYNAASGHFEQHVITTVRVVEREQRLLYKIRKSLLQGISDDDCLGLREEVAFQTKKPMKPAAFSIPLNGVNHTGTLKRPAVDVPDQSPANKYFVAETYPSPYAVPTNPPFPPNHSSTAHPSSNHASPPTPISAHPITPTSPFPKTSPASPKRISYIFQGVEPYASNTPISPSVTHTTTIPSSPLSPIPYHPHPPLKRWPNDYTVSEISTGFRQMDNMVSQTPNMTQRTAFERIFGCRYVKSTVCRHRGVWRRAEYELKEQYEAMGGDERAVWGEFVRKVEGRPAGKMGLDEVVAPHPATHEDEDEHVSNPQGSESATSSQAHYNSPRHMGKQMMQMDK